MAAVLTPSTAPAPWNEPGRPARPHLRLVEGGRSGRSVAAEPTPVRRPVGAVVSGLVLAALIALAAVGAVHVLGADAAASGPASTADAPHPVGADASTSSAPAAVVVAPGDSLWSIAQRLDPGADVRPLVDALADRLGSTTVVAGQHIDVTGLVD